MWTIKATKERLGPNIYKHILFLHAVLGCDATSRLHGIGKGTSLKKIKESDKLPEQAKMFYEHSASTDDVAEAGDKAMVILRCDGTATKFDTMGLDRECQGSP